eukprot:8495660-Alexandrium_andersonii.AAC.1
MLRMGQRFSRGRRGAGLKWAVPRLTRSPRSLTRSPSAEGPSSAARALRPRPAVAQEARSTSP